MFRNLHRFARGPGPLGYDAIDRKVVVNEREAETVRHIFHRYAKLGSVRSLKEDLDAAGVTSKVRVNRTGRRWGGNPLARGALYLMLNNRITLGEIVHKDKHTPGQHDAIIDIFLAPTPVAEILRRDALKLAPASECDQVMEQATLSVPARMRRAGIRMI